MSEPVISTTGLSIDYRIGSDWMQAVHSVDLNIHPLQIHGLVGESGSGKSTIAMAMIRNLARNARIADGRVLFDDRDLRQIGQKEIEEIWGDQITLVPQNTMDSLNPSMRISRQMTEVTRRHTWDLQRRKRTSVRLMPFAASRSPTPSRFCLVTHTSCPGE